MHTRPLRQTEKRPTAWPRGRAPVGGHDVHYPTSECVRLNRVDREPIQVKQTRDVRDRLRLNMLNVRTPVQARDLTF